MLMKRMTKRSDMIACQLCKDAPCSEACSRMDPAGALFHIWFDNEDVAALKLPERYLCAGCEAPCEKACVKPGEVPIKKLMGALIEEVRL
ncbi:MAG: hypothetical protein IJT05_02850, partial [Lachnospiraceae bacterium]|nr:hypothetical protein [Lachnospiraceae bacterium]